MWERVIQAISDHHRFVITTHLNPDGDAIGSELALAEFLADLSKEVRIINVHPAPHSYQFLPGSDRILLFDSDEARDWLRRVDAAFVLDISTWARLGALGNLLTERAVPTICIDHHPSPDHGPGSAADVSAEGPILVVDVGASATGELVYDLIMGVKGTLSPSQAEAIYVALLTDTGSFRFPNTTARTHRIAADLVEMGIDPARIYDCIYGRSSMPRLQLMGRALTSIETRCDGKIAYVAVTQRMLEETGAQPDDTEGLVDLARRVEGVEISLCFVEQGDGKVKLSVRSPGVVRVNGLARQFGGGGHAYASGALPEGELDAVIEEVIGEACRLVRETHYERERCGEGAAGE
ncbi:hypothetical protein AMJ71_08100 [candidate division TA06 bacterium SM1_40]|uniref:DDH domain-containing protein n=2 Tax=Bacteria division TA06 TaxID=1156500 RepID=A0A0S8JJ03_UNCT6|nr:MAG: hypothetical protein AMJ82_00875 [candidate division TA06 bacterium SM23_40]KPL08555.1 MAG: hypothetical protein AMJ71_08100 [candidate division TA06 bacterium SM1_40]